MGVTPVSYAVSGALVNPSPTLTFVLASGAVLGSAALAVAGDTVRRTA